MQADPRQQYQRRARARSPARQRLGLERLRRASRGAIRGGGGARGCSALPVGQYIDSHDQRAWAGGCGDFWITMPSEGRARCRSCQLWLERQRVGVSRSFLEGRAADLDGKQPQSRYRGMSRLGPDGEQGKRGCGLRCGEAEREEV